MSEREVLYHLKKPEEVITFTFDFSRVDETITTANVVATYYGGKPDASPHVMVTGSASLEGGIVRQRISGGQNGTVYLLTCTATDDEGETHIDAAKVLVMSREVK